MFVSLMMVQWPVARFWVPLSAWHVLPMSARVLSRDSCPLLLSKVLWLRDRCIGIVASAASSVRWRCDGVVTRPGCLTPLKWMNGPVPATQTDEMRESGCYTSLPLDGSKRHTMMSQRLFAFCFLFFRCSRQTFKLFIHYLRLTFYQLLGYHQGDIIRN